MVSRNIIKVTPVNNAKKIWQPGVPLTYRFN